MLAICLLNGIFFLRPAPSFHGGDKKMASSKVERFVVIFRTVITDALHIREALLFYICHVSIRSYARVTPTVDVFSEKKPITAHLLFQCSSNGPDLLKFNKRLGGSTIDRGDDETWLWVTRWCGICLRLKRAVFLIIRIWEGLVSIVLPSQRRNDFPSFFSRHRATLSREWTSRQRSASFSN